MKYIPVAKAALFVAVLGFASPAYTQGALQFGGALTAGHLLMSSGGRALDAGGPTTTGGQPQNSTLPGTRPSGLGIVNSGLGNCQWSAYASGAYSQLCSGFGNDGNPVFALDNFNGASASAFNFRINGTNFPFPTTINTIPVATSAIPALHLSLTPTGSDANACTVAAPCASGQRAVSVCYSYDLNGGDCQIDVNGPGTYTSTSAILAMGPLRGSGTGVLAGRLVVPGGSAGAIIFNGIGNPIITHTGSQCGTIYVSNGANASLAGTLTLQSNSACAFGGELVVQDPGSFASIVGGNVTFGPMTEASGSHINLQQQGLVEVSSAGYKILAAAAGNSAANHAIVTTGGSLINDGGPITCLANGANAVNLGSAFYSGQIAGQVNIGAATSYVNCGGVTALQASVTGNSVVQNFASGIGPVPGTGSVAQGGGQYLDAANHNLVANGIAGRSTFTNPAGTAAGPVMMGLGVGHTLTPATTGRVSITFAGQANNSLGSQGGVTTLIFGTGAAPANGAAIPGGTTICGQAISIGNLTGSGAIPFALPCYVALTAGTSYWFDIALTSNSGSNTETLTNISSHAFEIN